MLLVALGCGPTCGTDTANETFLKVDFDHQEASGTYDISVEWDAERVACQVQWSSGEHSCAGTSDQLEMWISEYDIAGFEILDTTPEEVRITVKRDGATLYDDVLVPVYEVNTFPSCPGDDFAWARETISF